MTVATKPRTSRNGNGGDETGVKGTDLAPYSVEKEEVEIRPIVLKTIELTLVGASPLLMDNGIPAQQQIEDSKKGPVERGRRKPVDDAAIEAKWLASRYLTADGHPAIQSRAIALSIADGSSAHFKTTAKSQERAQYVFRAITIVGPELLPIQGVASKDFHMLRTLGKNANRGKKADEGTTDVRYRAELPASWRVTFTLRFRADMLKVAEVIEAARSAGESIGVGAWRKQKGGTHGMFTVLVGKEMTVSGK